MKKRNPIARVVTQIPPQVIPDKRQEKEKEFLDWMKEKELIEYKDGE